MPKSDSLRFAQLLDWLEGRVSPEEAQGVAGRLSQADEATQADLAWLRAFQRARQTVRLAAPPEHVRDALKERFKTNAEAHPASGFFQRLLASLTFDSHAQLAASGIRSAAAEGLQRQMIYTTTIAEIALNLRRRPLDERLVVSGQIFATADVPPERFSVQLLHDAREVALATTDELGEFAFGPVPAGHYELIMSAGYFEVVIPSVTLQQE